MSLRVFSKGSVLKTVSVVQFFFYKANIKRVFIENIVYGPHVKNM